MTKGRKPTPSKIKQLRGRPDHRPINADEPEFQTGIPEPPAHLTAAALLEWTRITNELAAKNVITTVDLAILAVYCATFAQLCEEEEALKLETSIKETPKGYQYINARVGLVKSLRNDIAKYAAELGITPSSRSRIKVMASPPSPKNKKRILAENLFGVTVSK